MTENLMGTGMAGPGPELPEETPAAGRDPKVLIGGGIGLAVVAVVGGYLLLGGGGGGSSAATPAATRPVVHTAVTTTPSASAAAAATATAAIKTFNGDVGRDPFRALITPPPAPTTTAAPTSTAPAATTTTLPAVATTSPGSVVGLPTTGITVLPTSGVTVAPPVTAAPTTTAPAVTVVLKAIAFHGTTPYVVVSFSGKSLALKTGDTSAGNLKVVAIAPDDGTATFQLGDQTFDLHIGQSYVD